MPAMSAAALQRRYSYAEYLVIEESSETRHEYCQGVILAMAGGTGAHAKLKMNLGGLLFVALRGRPCEPRDVDQRVRITATDLATYPDLSVVCGDRIPAPDDRHALTNPTVLFEVLSKGSAGYDQGEKFDHYAHLATLKQYVCIDSERVHAYVFTRTERGTWDRETVELGGIIRLDSIDVSLSMDELYEGWAKERAIDAGTA
jgi:Uma2 family endonuclease